MPGRVVARFLGGFRVEADGQVVQLSGARVARAILAYILINPDRHHFRSRLAGMFWPEVSEQQARRRLRTALWKIRSGFAEVGVEIFDQHPDWVGVREGTDLWVDVVDYRRLAASAETPARVVPEMLMEADGLYRGDFLAGHYNDWVFEEQQHLRATHLGLLRRLMKVRESEGRYERALLIAQRIVGMDQLDEASHRDIIRINAILRRPEDAQRAYRVLKGILRHEFGAEPSAESAQLIDDIARQAEGNLGVVRSADTSRAPVFVARSRERTLLIDRLESLRSGRGSILLLEGPAGVGKTSLLNQVAEDAKWRNVEVVWGNYQDRSSEAFEGLRGAIEAALTPLRVEQLKTVVDEVWLEEASKMLPSLTLGGEVRLRRRLTGDDARLRMYEALVQVLCGLATIYPTMLVLEDVHWADRDSLHVLDALAAKLPAVSMAVVLTYRRDEIDIDETRWPLMSSIDRHPVTTRTALSDLDETAVAELLASIGGFGGDLETLAQRLVQQTSGNPLFVVETLKSLRDLETNEVVPDQLPVADSVGEIVEARLARLGPPRADVVAAAAVVARPMSVQQLTLLTGAQYESVLESVTEIVDREILNDDPDGLLFSHALVRRIAYRRIEPWRRKELHSAAATMLIEIGATPAEIAHHFVEAQTWNEGAEWSYQAAQAAEAVAAFDTARGHYETALMAVDHGAVGDDLTWSVLAGAEHVADVLGDRESQAALLERMSGLATIPKRQAQLSVRRARWLANTDRLAEAKAVVESGIGLDQASDRRLEVLLGQIMVWTGDVRAAIEQLAQTCADGGGSSAAHRMLGVAYAEVQDYGLALEHLALALTEMRSSDDAEGTAGVLSMMGTVYAEQGKFEEAEDALQDALAIARAIGFRKAEAECLVNLATIKAISNRPGTALQLFEEAAQAFLAIGHERGTALVNVNLASLLRDFAGDFDQAERLATIAHDYFRETGDFVRQATAAAVLAGIVAVRDPERGMAQYRDLAEEVEAHDAEWLGRQIAESLVRLLLEHGHTVEARQRLDLLAASVEEDQSTATRLQVDALEALVLFAEGKGAAAADRARTVVAGLDPETPDGYRLAYSAFVSLGSDPAHSEDRLAAISLAHELMETAFEGLSEEEAGHSRTVLLHRSIAQAHNELVARHADVELAPIGATSTKGETEVIRATVTVYHPDDLSIDQPMARRQAQIRRLIAEIDNAGGQFSIKLLARLLETSQATVKRDLAALRASGEIPSQ